MLSLSAPFGGQCEENSHLVQGVQCDGILHAAHVVIMQMSNNISNVTANNTRKCFPLDTSITILQTGSLKMKKSRATLACLLSTAKRGR